MIGWALTRKNLYCQKQPKSVVASMLETAKTQNICQNIEPSQPRRKNKAYGRHINRTWWDSKPMFTLQWDPRDFCTILVHTVTDSTSINVLHFQNSYFLIVSCWIQLTLSVKVDINEVQFVIAGKTCKNRVRTITYSLVLTTSLSLLSIYWESTRLIFSGELECITF